MADNHYLPDLLRLAPPENIRLVHADTPPTAETVPFAVAGPNDPQLHRARQAWTGAHALCDPRPVMTLDRPVADWQGLLSETVEVVQQHINGCDISEYAKPHSPSGGIIYGKKTKVAEVREELSDTALQGIATATAFLRVIPHVLKDEELSDPNTELADVARRSAALITEWARVEGTTDYQLVNALSAKPRPKLRGQPDRLLFRGLRLDPANFTDRGGVVVPDPDKLGGLPTRKGTPLRKYDQGTHPLFGCLFLSEIPRLSKLMITRAQKDELFGREYEDARAGLTQN